MKVGSFTKGKLSAIRRSSMSIPVPIPASQLAIFFIEIAAVIIVGYLAFRQFREKRININSMWVLPAFMFLISYTGIQNDLFDTAYSAAIIALGFVVGLALGGLRGALIKVRLDHEQKAIFVKGTPVSVVLWILLLAVKGIADVGLSAAGVKQEAVG